MAPKSPFPRIVLVKSLFDDCLPTLKECIGKYTHIQSFNGVLLDGLSIADVTTIIQDSLGASQVQLVVRYVHPVQTNTFTIGLTGNVVPMDTPITPNLPDIKQAANRIDPSTETLPIPLMILGDIHVHCKELFRYLSGQEKMGSREDVDSQVSTRTGSNMAPRNSVSLLVPSSRPTRSETSASSYESAEGSDIVDSALFQSDKYVMRLGVSGWLFSTSNLTSSPLTTPIRTGHPPTYQRQHTIPSVDKRYILNMFTQEMDRKFVHLFLRQGGVYVVVVSLEDLVEDPVIQFENLSFWLRLVQTYVSPSGIKRVLIVGMANSGVLSQREHECLGHLEGALRESGFQHVYDRDGTSVIVFDRSKPRSSVEHLCHSIGRCMDAITTRAWHMHRQFFESVFQPFSGLTEVLSSISRSSKMLMSADTMQSLYQYAELNYFDTLAAYSSALISDRRKCVCACACMCVCMCVCIRTCACVHACVDFVQVTVDSYIPNVFLSIADQIFQLSLKCLPISYLSLSLSPSLSSGLSTEAWFPGGPSEEAEPDL